MFVDWSDCRLVEVKPDVQRGRPVVRGTRVTVEDSVIGNWEAGLEPTEIVELFPAITIQQVETILSYAVKHRMHDPRPA